MTSNSQNSCVRCKVSQFDLSLPNMLCAGNCAVYDCGKCGNPRVNCIVCGFYNYLKAPNSMEHARRWLPRELARTFKKSFAMQMVLTYLTREELLEL